MNISKSRSFGLICDGEVEITTLTESDLENALEVLNTSFFLSEYICCSTEINLPESEESREELRELCREVWKDGISLIAKHLPTNQVVGVAFNKIQHLGNPDEEPFFVNFNKTRCHTPNSKCLMEYMIKMDESFDIFKYFEINCLIEIMFLATLPKFQGKQIGRTLCQKSIELGQELKSGIGLERIKKDLQDKRPKAVAAIFTSKYSQRIGNVLGFEVLKQVPNTDFSFNGKRFHESEIYPFTVLSGKKI